MAKFRSMVKLWTLKQVASTAVREQMELRRSLVSRSTGRMCESDKLDYQIAINAVMMNIL